MPVQLPSSTGFHPGYPVDDNVNVVMPTPHNVRPSAQGSAATAVPAQQAVPHQHQSRNAGRGNFNRRVEVAQQATASKTGLQDRFPGFDLQTRRAYSGEFMDGRLYVHLGNEQIARYVESEHGKATPEKLMAFLARNNDLPPMFSQGREEPRQTPIDGRYVNIDESPGTMAQMQNEIDEAIRARNSTFPRAPAAKLALSPADQMHQDAYEINRAYFAARQDSAAVHANPASQEPRQTLRYARYGSDSSIGSNRSRRSTASSAGSHDTAATSVSDSSRSSMRSFGRSLLNNLRSLKR
ncbi:MAG: hypothetical protein ACRYGK_02460 [Janthinobacterium lividum]